MKSVQPSLAAAVIAATLSLPVTGLAVAEDRSLVSGPAFMVAANTDDAGEVASDTWITTKVKSSLLADDATPGMDISVETKDGVVSLAGTVPTEAQREAAIAKAKSIKGVREVMADGLKTVD